MHEYIDFPGRTAVKVKRREEQRFTYPWHFHSEYELLYIIKGSGTRYVADSIQTFNSGDLVLLGSNLPHFWKQDASYDAEKADKKLEYIVIQFPRDLFNKQVSNYPEFRLIGDLLERSSRGIRFIPGHNKTLLNLILKMPKVKDIERIILLLRILQSLSEVKECEILAGELYRHENLSFGNDRLTKVLHHISSNYQQKIDLETVADISSMHPSAFCRFFKEKTGKSLLEYVNYMRISYACKLILEHRLSVAQICYEAGFNNLSNFNRSFKKQTGFTPTEYLEQYNRNL